MTGQAGSLVADAFHQIAIGDDGVGIVVKDREARAVEGGGEEALGDRHTHAVGKALPQGAGGRLDAGCEAVFRMARRAAAPLAKALQFVQRQVVAGEVEQAIQEHRAVPGGKDEAVTVGPGGVGGVVLEKACPQDVGRVGHAHRHTRVAGLGLLHPVHRQRADGVDAELIVVHRWVLSSHRSYKPVFFQKTGFSTFLLYPERRGWQERSGWIAP